MSAAESAWQYILHQTYVVYAQMLHAGGVSCAGEDIRERTDALDAAGNTTAAIGKGFAIGSAALVSLALFGAYVTRSKIDLIESSILDPKVGLGAAVSVGWDRMCGLVTAAGRYWFIVWLYGLAAATARLEHAPAILHATPHPAFTIGSSIVASLCFLQVWLMLVAAVGAVCSRQPVNRRANKLFASVLVVCMLQVFGGLLVGAMLPFWFSAMTMKSVGKAALAMVEEVRRQFNTINGLMEGTARPDYSRCVQISTDSSLREMIPPGKEHVFFSESTALDSLAGY
jgi:Na+/H+-translocating membrane pyrophosphatase